MKRRDITEQAGIMKKQVCCVLLFIAAALGGCATAGDNGSKPSAGMEPAQKGEVSQLAPDLSVYALRPGVFIAEHSLPWPSNSLVAVMRNGDIVLVDTPYTPGATHKLLAWIRKNFKRKPVLAINTHFHIDRTGGNAALLEEGVAIFGPDLTARMFRERAERSRKRLAGRIDNPRVRKEIAAVPLKAPTNIFPVQEGLSIKAGDEEIRVVYPGPGHSPDNVVVSFPSKRLMFAGCLLLDTDRDSAGDMADADADAWLDALDRIPADGIDLLVPGHGRASGKNIIDHTRRVVRRTAGRRQ